MDQKGEAGQGSERQERGTSEYSGSQFRTAGREAGKGGRGDRRAQQILRLIDEVDLVAPNVAGALNASLAFSRGFEQGGGFDMPLSDSQLLAETWAQRDQIEAEATDWLRAYLLLSYSSLHDDEMEAYIAYASSREGKVVAQVLFDAFDQMLRQTSFDLGMAAALRMQGREL